MTQPKDYFSRQSLAYKRFRPSYPRALFDYLLADCPADARVWDCATGNGQAAQACAERVTQVIASDMSAKQLAQATPCANVCYIQAVAEQMPLPDRSIDVVTIAQALHWFDFDAFYREVKRVVKPGGKIAAWTYSFLAVAPQLGNDIETVIRWFYHDVVGPYWPPERAMVDDQYQSISFPFKRQQTPSFSIDVSWNLESLLGYLGSWSATQAYRNAHGDEPLDLLRARLAPVWGEPNVSRDLSWRLGVIEGRV